jgi:nitrous oxidase accessory protein
VEKMLSAINVCKRGRALRIAVGITMLALLLAGGANAATLTVNASGGADYTRIQDAVNAASNGDTITVAAGTYNENVVVNKSLSEKSRCSERYPCTCEV